MDYASSTANAVREAADRTAIRAVIDLYFYGLDRRDREALKACFTPDAHVRYQIGTPVEFTRDGNDAIADHFYTSMTRQTMTTHLGANVVIAIDGDTATAVVNGMASVVQGERVLMRGLRYEDELVRYEGGWRIRKRIHTPLWQFNSASVKPEMPGYAATLEVTGKTA